ncbi:MAG: TIGR04211 family SH3 domain-containing protein [Pseudomonadota bacterium]
MPTSKRLALATLTAAFTLTAHAETAYINDQLEVTLRSGESTRHSIDSMLTSGTALTVLSRNAETGYAQVRLQNGRTGYVLSRFLTDAPIARDRLRAAEQALARLTSQKANVDDEIAVLRADNRDVSEQIEDLIKRNETLTLELSQVRSTAADALNIDADNKRLNAKLTDSENTIARLTLENEQLEARNDQSWFMLGAAAVLLGALLGFTLPRMRWRRKSSWGEL